VQLLPLLESEIDDDETGGRQLLAQPLADFDIAAGDQQRGEFVEAWIVADQQKRACGVGRFLDNVYKRIGLGFIQAAVMDNWRRRGKCRGGEGPGLARALRRRYHHLIGDQRMAGHIGAKLGRVLASTGIEDTVVVAQGAVRRG
jgi:hypothetical protein